MVLFFIFLNFVLFYQTVTQMKSHDPSFKIAAYIFDTNCYFPFFLLPYLTCYTENQSTAACISC